MMQSCVYLGPGELLEFESMIRCGPSARSDAVFSVDCKLVFCYVKDICGMRLMAKQSGAVGGVADLHMRRNMLDWMFTL